MSGFYRRLSNVLRRAPLLIRIPYYVYRFFQPKYTIGVVGVVLNEHKQVLIVEHLFHPEMPWGLPGGWIGHNENPAYTVERELYEELELKVNVQGVIHVQRTDYQHIDIAYRCEPLSSVGKLSYELLDFRWVTPGVDQAIPPLHKFHRDAIMLAVQAKNGC